MSASNRLSLTLQVYDILRKEIRAGRWRIGDRLPSISALARQSGLSRMPIQQAFERLGREGCLRSRGRAGTFLSGVPPEERGVLGAIGVPVLLNGGSSEARPNAHDQWRLHEILQAAAARNCLAEVAYLDSSVDPESIDTVGGVFGERVKGIIAIKPFRHAPHVDLPPEKIPLVFLGAQDPQCIPSVAADLRLGCYTATRRLIAMGHRNLVFCAEKSWGSASNDVRLQGFEQAMNEARLAFNRAAVRNSLAMRDDLSSLGGFLETFHRATAIVCISMLRSRDLIRVAQMMGRRVPEDLSVIATAKTPLDPAHDGLELGGVEFDFRQAVDMCLEMLAKQAATRRIPFASVRLWPSFAPGATAGPPARKPPGRSSGPLRFGTRRHGRG